MLSQFLHGEQGALFAAAQVTEAVQFFDGKLYGATQVIDEGRHVEVFHRYLDTKLEKLYQVNDNLFVIIDALMTDARWDMKFLGMQIMVEGLALGAFGTLYKQTKEPLLKELLKYVIQDEARHVHYGVLALRDHIEAALATPSEREREDWAFEVALLMRNRFLAYEVYEEWFEGDPPARQVARVRDRTRRACTSSGRRCSAGSSRTSARSGSSRRASSRATRRSACSSTWAGSPPIASTATACIAELDHAA